MSVKTQISVYGFSMDNKQSYHLWKEYICRINIIQYLPLKYSESCLLGTPVTQQPCVFSNAETDFFYIKNWTWLSIFHFNIFHYFLFAEVADSVYFLSMKQRNIS